MKKFLTSDKVSHELVVLATIPFLSIRSPIRWGVIHTTPTIENLEAQMAESFASALNRQVASEIPFRLLWGFAITIVSLGLGLLLASRLPSDAGLSESWPALTCVVVGYGSQVGTMTAIRRAGRGVTASLAIASLIVKLERHPDRWGKVQFKGEVNDHLELLARLYVRLGKGLHPGDPVTSRAFERQSLGHAAAVRELKFWVTTPGPFTFTDLLARLSADLRSVLTAEWQSLPWVEPPSELGPAMSRTRRALWALTGLLFLAAAAGLTLLAARLGSFSTIAVGVVLALGVVALGNAGLPLGALGDAKSLTDKFRSSS